MTNNVFAAFCIVIRALRLSCAAPNAVTFTAVCCGTWRCVHCMTQRCKTCLGIPGPSCALVAPRCGLLLLKVEMARRCACWTYITDKCWNSSNHVVRPVARLGVYFQKMPSPIGQNAQHCASRTSVFDRRTFPDLRSTCSWQVTTYVDINRPLHSAKQANSNFRPFGIGKWVVVGCN